MKEKEGGRERRGGRGEERRHRRGEEVERRSVCRQEEKRRVGEERCLNSSSSLTLLHLLKTWTSKSCLLLIPGISELPIQTDCITRGGGEAVTLTPAGTGQTVLGTTHTHTETHTHTQRQRHMIITFLRFGIAG